MDFLEQKNQYPKLRTCQKILRAEQSRRKEKSLTCTQAKKKILSKLKHREKTVINQRIWNMWDGAKLPHIHVSAISDKETKIKNGAKAICEETIDDALTRKWEEINLEIQWEIPKEKTQRKTHLDIPNAWHSQTDEIKDIEKMLTVARGGGKKTFEDWQLPFFVCWKVLGGGGRMGGLAT